MGKVVQELDEAVAEVLALVEADIANTEPGASAARLELARSALDDAHQALVARSAEVAAAKRQAESQAADVQKAQDAIDAKRAEDQAKELEARAAVEAAVKAEAKAEEKK